MERPKREHILGVVMALAVYAIAIALVAHASGTFKGSFFSSWFDFESVSDIPEPKKAQLPTEPFWVLVLGNDTRAGTASSDTAYEDRKPFDCRTDTMMLVRIDPKKYLISIVSIPRDTMMYRGDKPWKINTAYYDGYEEVFARVEELTGVRAQHRLELGFSTFTYFIDGLGGVTVDVTVTTSLDDIMGSGLQILYPGEQELNGIEALVLARMRKQYANDMEVSRQIQDRKIVQAGIQKVLDNPELAQTALDVFYAYVETDWSRDEFEPLVLDFIAHADQVHFQSGTGPYEGGTVYVDGEAAYFDYRDEETWAEVINVVEAGGDPTDVVPLPVVAL